MTLSSKICYNNSMNTYRNLKSITNSKSVCLIAHTDPDPDALASMVVFQDFLKSHLKIEKVNLFAECKNLSEKLKEILEDTQININETNYETAIMMDCPNSDRLGKYKSLFENAKNKVVIDHHATNNYSGNINIVELCSSTCEIVYSILKSFNYETNSKQQGKLYAGIITDTNNFIVGALTNRTFKFVSEFAENIDRELIYRTFLANNSTKSMKLLALAIKNIQAFENNQIIITHLTKEDVNRHNAEHNDMCGIVNQIASINSAKLVCFIEPKNNLYYASMRAKKGYDVSKIATQHGGGGHIGAAAFVSNKSLEETQQLVLQEFKKHFASVKPKNIKVFR